MWFFFFYPERSLQRIAPVIGGSWVQYQASTHSPSSFLLSHRMLEEDSKIQWITSVVISELMVHWEWQVICRGVRWDLEFIHPQIPDFKYNIGFGAALAGAAGGFLVKGDLYFKGNESQSKTLIREISNRVSLSHDLCCPAWFNKVFSVIWEACSDRTWLEWCTVRKAFCKWKRWR